MWKQRQNYMESDLYSTGVSEKTESKFTVYELLPKYALIVLALCGKIDRRELLETLHVHCDVRSRCRPVHDDHPSASLEMMLWSLHASRPSFPHPTFSIDPQSRFPSFSTVGRCQPPQSPSKVQWRENRAKSTTRRLCHGVQH